MLNRNPQNNLMAHAAFRSSSSAQAIHFESVAMLHLNDLYRTALHLLQQPAKASMAVEESCRRARHSFNEDSRGANSRVWLFRILIQVVRSMRMQSMTAGRTHGYYVPNSKIVSAMKRIPADTREALVLVDGQGFSYSDAARILGLSTDVVAHQITNGRNHLQSEMEGIGL